MWIYPVAFAAAIALSGCQNLNEIDAEDQSATVRNTEGLQPLQRYPLTIRTFKAVSEKKKQEVTGLSCTLSSRQLQASLVTPGRVRVPAFAAGKRFKDGGKPSPITVTCQGGGLKGQQTFEAVQPRAGGSSSTTTYASNGSAQTISTMGLDLGLSSSFPWGFTSINLIVE
ncbi:hypothetical protein AKJ29_07635 [Aliiroseovarius crassostreae]|uniref:Lipoprotein n=2 Tax=Aliiroseovarius crassostreae TaxID=154981 RepID=A0A0P7IDK2_9RHOB|nr:hypothetical protein AKJ29_07635 [Aliiroseovarius crassostreae]